MKIQKAGPNEQAVLLALMRESAEKGRQVLADEWQKTETAIVTLLDDPQAGEAFLTFDGNGNLTGYIIMCRGFSLEYGGYFTWVEESYMRQSEQGRFRDQRFLSGK
jgi:hypothetical protein